MISLPDLQRRSHMDSVRNQLNFPKIYANHSHKANVPFQSLIQLRSPRDCISRSKNLTSISTCCWEACGCRFTHNGKGMKRRRWFKRSWFSRDSLAFGRVEGLDFSFADIEVLELEIFTKSLQAWKIRFTKTSSFRGAKLKPGKSTDDTDASKSDRLHSFQSSAHPLVLGVGLLSDKVGEGLTLRCRPLGSQGSNKILCPSNEMILGRMK